MEGASNGHPAIAKRSSLARCGEVILLIELNGQILDAIESQTAFDGGPDHLIATHNRLVIRLGNTHPDVLFRGQQRRVVDAQVGSVGGHVASSPRVVTSGLEALELDGSVDGNSRITASVVKGHRGDLGQGVHSPTLREGWERHL